MEISFPETYHPWMDCESPVTEHKIKIFPKNLLSRIISSLPPSPSSSPPLPFLLLRIHCLFLPISLTYSYLLKFVVFLDHFLLDHIQYHVFETLCYLLNLQVFISSKDFSFVNHIKLYKCLYLHMDV